MASGGTQHRGQLAAGRVPSAARHVRAVLAGLLLVIVLVGVRAAYPAAAADGPWHDRGVALAVALEAVLAALLIALWITARRRPDPGYPAVLLRAGLVRLIPLGMVAVAVLAVLSGLHLTPGKPRSTPATRTLFRTQSPKVIKAAAAQNETVLTYVLYALLALLVVTAIVACVVVILRHLPAARPATELPVIDDDDETLRQAVESARHAMRAFDDAQAAIIACYVAMESSLAEAGASRAAAETPDELLTRAVTSGLLQGSAAGRLTALFYEARFSSHALPDSARDEAVRALDEISAELARRAETGGSAEASGSPEAGGSAEASGSAELTGSGGVGSGAAP